MTRASLAQCPGATTPKTMGKSPNPHFSRDWELKYAPLTVAKRGSFHMAKRGEDKELERRDGQKTSRLGRGSVDSNT